MITLKVTPTETEGGFMLSHRIWASEYKFKKGLNLLYGGNGAGKTSILELFNVNKYRKAEVGKDFDVVGESGKRIGHQIASYKMSENNASRKRELGDYFSFARFMQQGHMSEGMAVAVSAFDFIYAMSEGFGDPVGTTFVVVADEIDSGLDPHACRLVMGKMKEAIDKNPDMYVIVSFNQYEIARTARELGLADAMVSAYDGSAIPIPSSYDEYYSILEADKSSHRRRGDEGAWGADEEEWHDPYLSDEDEEEARREEEDEEEGGAEGEEEPEEESEEEEPQGDETPLRFEDLIVRHFPSPEESWDESYGYNEHISYPSEKIGDHYNDIVDIISIMTGEGQS